MRIEIIDIRMLPGDKPLRAFVDLKVDEIVFREFRIIKENGKRLWVACPQISWKDSDGQLKYKTVVTLPDELKGEIDRIVLNRFIRETEQKDAYQ
jgi:DNA-binding cell septation regulator SpoVG